MSFFSNLRVVITGRHHRKRLAPADVTDVAAGIQPSTLVRQELGCMILAFRQCRWRSHEDLREHA